MPPHSQQIFCQTRTQEIIDSILERIEIGLDRHYYCLAHAHTVFYDIAKVNTCSGKAFERFLNHRKTSPLYIGWCVCHSSLYCTKYEDRRIYRQFYGTAKKCIGGFL